MTNLPATAAVMLLAAGAGEPLATGPLRESELLTLVLALGVLLFCLVNRARLRELPAWGTLWAGFLTLLGAWTMTVCEAVFSGGIAQVLNVGEHACYVTSAVLALMWCWRALGLPEEQAHAAGTGHS